MSGLDLSHIEDSSTETLHIYHQDEQGSTAYITESDGAAENCYSYDAFGNVLESRENVRNRMLYTGQQYDWETGQYYLRARYYNPVIGRFVQEDTYRGDGLNLYAYCGNNPVMYYDPSGYSSKSTRLCSKSDVEELEETNDTGRHGALNEAKRDANIPQSQHPDYVEQTPMRQDEYDGGHVIKDDDRKVIMTREYHYKNMDGEEIVIQDHSGGHKKGD